MTDRRQSLSSDPFYYVMVAIFALLTTGLPALIGQPRFLPIAQAIALTIFIAIPIRDGLWRRAATVMALWLILELSVVTAITILAPEHMERSFSSGFEVKSELLAWVYGVESLPGGAQKVISTGMAQIAGVALGSLVTAGLVGNWFLVRTVNLTGFGIGIVWGAIGVPAGIILAIPLWDISRIAGLAGFVILFSEPLLSSNWSPKYYWENRRALIVGSLILIILGTLLGVVGPPTWQSFIAAQVQ